MGCCGDNKKPDFQPESWVIHGAKEPDLKLQEWHVVVLTARKHNHVNVLIRTLSKIQDDYPLLLTWTLVDTAAISSPKFHTYVKSLGGEYIALPRETNIPRAYNIGIARCRRSSYTLILHDDVVVPSDRHWLDALNMGIKRGAGVTVPHLEGECSNRSQSFPNYGAVIHTQEYISSAAMAFPTKEIAGEGLNETLTGYDWWQIEYQVRMARLGRAVLVAPCTLTHHGMLTFRFEPRPIGEIAAYNLDRIKQDLGWENDFKRRPRLPRIHRFQPDAETGKGLAVIVDCPCQINRGYDIMTQEGFSQMAVLDVVHDHKTEEELDFFERHNLTYQPVFEDPFLQGVNAVDYQQVAVVDMRDGANLSRVEGKRLRCGSHYKLPSQITDYHIGMLRHYALGDTLMMTPALHAFKQAYPWIDLHVHHAWDGGQLLKHNPDIKSISTYDMERVTPPMDVVDIGVKNGTEETILAPYDELGLSRPEGIARLRYFVTDEEREDAVQWLKDRGVDCGFSSAYLVAVQKHGGWRAKKWVHHDRTVSWLQDSGASVLVFGADKDRLDGLDEAKPNPGVIIVANEPIRRVFALISLIDALVCFDSGLGYGAAALGIPCVSLWGPHDPRQMMAIAGPNQTCLRKRTPKLCETERGASCRQVTGGSACPFRADGIGADCLDEIMIEDVAEHLLTAPRWKRAITDRR